MHLWCLFYVSRPMFGQAQLDELQAVINHVLPRWSRELRVARDEDSPTSIVVGREQNLHRCIHRVARPMRHVGEVVLTGAYEGLTLFLSHCDRTLPPELNDLAIEVYGPSTVEGQEASAWTRTAFEAVVARLPVRYGHTRTREEFAAKNMIDDERGVEAMGVNLVNSLPGLYWLNYFGAPYVELIGRERLLSAPAFEAKPVADGVLIALDASADAWQTATYQQRERTVIEHLGKQYFFSRHDPARQTVAPDFRAQQA